MIRIVVTLMLLFFFACKKKQETTKPNFDCKDERACLEFEKKLKLVHDFNFLSKPSNNGELEKVQRYLDSVTTIETTADISYSGLNPPTIEDYENWSFWYSENYNCLTFNSKNSQLIIDENCVEKNMSKYE